MYFIYIDKTYDIFNFIYISKPKHYPKKLLIALTTN